MFCLSPPFHFSNNFEIVNSICHRRIKPNRSKMPPQLSQEFDRSGAIEKFINYLNDHHPNLELEEAEELESKRRKDALYLVFCGIPQTLDDISHSSDGSGSANTTTILCGRQRERIIERLHRWLLYLMRPHTVDGQIRYPYACPNDAKYELFSYFRVFEISKDVYEDWVRPIAPADPVEQH